MMSEGDAQAPMWSYQVNLEKRVRDDHPLRRINQVLDLGFVRKQVAHTYGQRGNKSVPPAAIVAWARVTPTQGQLLDKVAECGW
jgi:hypothetical protein